MPRGERHDTIHACASERTFATFSLDAEKSPHLPPLPALIDSPHSPAAFPPTVIASPAPTTSRAIPRTGASDPISTNAEVLSCTLNSGAARQRRLNRRQQERLLTREREVALARETELQLAILQQKNRREHFKRRIERLRYERQLEEQRVMRIQAVADVGRR